MITKILNKYDGFTNYWYPDVKEKTIYESPDLEKYKIGCSEIENQLLIKYKKYIPNGWYGFSLGSPCPHNWYKIIDEFLEYLIDLQNQNKIQNFEIHQIKIKFGGIRFYIHCTCEDKEFNEFIELQVNKLENHLFDEKLIY